jgi:hypothetical protein
MLCRSIMAPQADEVERCCWLKALAARKDAISEIDEIGHRLAA